MPTLTAIGNPCTSISGEIASGIGSDKKHTAWCERTAVDLVRKHQAYLGNTAYLLSHDVREALLMVRVVGIIASQETTTAPLWRMQELIDVTRHVFLHGVPR